MDFTKPGVVGLAWEFPGTSRSRARECTGPWWGNRVMTWNLKLLWNWIWFSFYFTWAEHFSYLKFVLPLWLFFVFWGAWDQRPGAGGVVLGCGLRKEKCSSPDLQLALIFKRSLSLGRDWTLSMWTWGEWGAITQSMLCFLFFQQSFILFQIGKS